MPTLESLASLCQLLLKRSDDALVENLTLRTLLEKRGAFSAEEYEAAHDKLYAEYISRASDVVARRFLESFSGPNQ